MNLEQFLLLKLSEEAVEISKECSKCIQFGMDEVYEPVGKSNRQRLIGELHDLLAIVEMLNEIGEMSRHKNLDYIPDKDIIEAKKKKVLHYLQYSVDLGQVTP